jgi:hypothetical protein
MSFVFVYQVNPADLVAQDQAIDIACQEDIAAAADDQWSSGKGDGSLQVFRGAKGRKPAGDGVNTESIEFFQGYITRNFHLINTISCFMKNTDNFTHNFVN